MTTNETKRPRIGWRWTKIFLLAGVIFASGMVVGAGMMMRFMGPPMKLHPIPEKAPEFITQSLKRDLALGDDQAKNVLQIFTENRAKLEALRERVDGEVLALMEEAHQQVGALLNPEQKRKLDQRFEHIKDRFRPNPSAK